MNLLIILVIILTVQKMNNDKVELWYSYWIGSEYVRK